MFVRMILLMKITNRAQRFALLCSLLVFGTSVHSQNPHIGAAYYPEQFPLGQVQKDIALMKEAGLNAVRMGDFAWVYMQPSEKQYSFGWLRSVVDSLGKNGIGTLLATPTAAIPKWMFDSYPDILQTTEGGTQKPYGKRRHACLNNEAYRIFSQSIAREMAKSFLGNKHIIGFQIDNELMAEDPYCYCETCRKGFGAWLQRKYGSIDSLNNTWGLGFWSEKLESFDKVFLPRKGDNPGCFVDFQAYYSDVTVGYFNLQRDAIQSVDPAFKVTHNICSSGFLYRLDQYELGKNADFLCIDNYPSTWTLENEYGPIDAIELHPAMASLALSQIRGSKGKPFIVAEAQMGRTAGRQRRLVAPGDVKLWSHQELAHGASGVFFFPFKTFPNAHEHLIAGIYDVDGIARERASEIKTTSAELTKAKAILGNAFPTAKAAIVRDFHADWSFEDGRFSTDFRYMRHLYSYYRAFREHGVTADIVSPNADFSGYKLIVVPALVSFDPALSAKLETAAKAGSVVLLTCMTGLRDLSQKSFNGLLHPSIEKLAGIKMETQYALLKQESTKVLMDGKSYSVSLWYDHFKTTTAKSLATYDSRFLQGNPVLTANMVGKGQVFYFGSVPNDEMADVLAGQLIKTAGAEPICKANDKLVDITELATKDKRFVYIVNFSFAPQPLTTNKSLKNLMGGAANGKALIVPARGAAVFEVLD